jgi:hypothetical protein
MTLVAGMTEAGCMLVRLIGVTCPAWHAEFAHDTNPCRASTGDALTMEALHPDTLSQSSARERLVQLQTAASSGSGCSTASCDTCSTAHTVVQGTLLCFFQVHAGQAAHTFHIFRAHTLVRQSHGLL